MFASIIIPTFNGASRIGKCLDALLPQIDDHEAEILVVDDGSTDGTAEICAPYPLVRVLRQANAGPAAARNRGALEAKGAIILFTDDDCVPAAGWLNAMSRPFDDPALVGVKGVYRTRQRELAARFVQVEYEDKYRRMRNAEAIDFIDTYSAGFRRERFLEVHGYDTSFPVACAEDVELSFRMSARGWLMKFVPEAVVYHTHPETFWKYLKKKYKFAFWRVLAVKKNPNKGLKDSHTPQLMKLQLLFPPILLLAMGRDLIVRATLPASMIVVALFAASTLPFSWRAFQKDPVIGLISPFLLAARACAQFLGVAGGMAHSFLRRTEAGQKSVA